MKSMYNFKKLMFLLVVLLFSGTVVGQSTANYVFTTADDGSLSDMTGATSILAAGVDDTPSAVTNIGFTFVFMGQPYTQFSVNDNGNMRLGATAIQGGSPYSMPNTTVPLLNPFGNDMRVGTDGNVTYKLFGSAPNRYLVVAWNNIMIRYLGTAAAGTASWEVRLHESGKIEYVYGRMTTNAATPAAYTVGFSVNTTSNNVLSVNTTTHTASVVTPVTTNTYTASSTITSLHSTADGSRRVYSFTPPSAPLAPADLSFTGIAQSGYTLNWTDNATNESGYAIYRSTDGITYTLINTTAADAITYAATGLQVETNYFWRVAAVNEGAISSFISGSQASAAAGTISSIATGNWNETTTWSTGTVPTATDNVTVAAGHTVTVNAAGVFNNLTVDGTLAFQGFTIAGGQATVSATGIVNVAAGTIGTLSVTRNVTNNGVMDFWASGTQYGKLLLTGTSAQTFTCGAASTTNIGNIEVVKTAIGNVADIITGGTFTIRSGAAAGFLTLTSGTFKISGTATVSNPVFLTAGYSIASTAGFWLSNPNFTVSGQNGSPTMSGLLRISNGIFNIGTTNNSMGFSSNSTVIIEGGVVNAVGRFGVGAAGNNVTYTQTGGVVNVSTMAAGNASTTLASFDLGTATSTVFNMSGGSIVVQKVCSGATGPGDYRGPAVGTYPTLNPNVNITGGTLQFGHSSSPATAQNFRIQGYAPSTNVNNETANHNLVLAGNTYLNGDFNTGAGTITLATGTTGYRLYAKGASFVNNGTIIATAALSRLWFLGTTPQTLSGTGTITAPIAGMYIDNPTTVTIDPASNNFVVNYIFLYKGVLNNSNKLTIGNGGTTDPWIVRGGLATAIAGSFDQAPSFNVGSGGLEVDYAVASAPISTGFELSHPADVLVMQTNVDVTLSQPYSVGSFGFAATNTGKFITANDKLLTITGTLPTSINSVAGNTGYVQGPLARTLPASLTGTLTYAFPIGKGTSNLLEFVNPTTTADGPVIVKAEVFDAATGGTAGAGIQTGSLGNRYWNAEIVSGAANLTNTAVRVTQAAPALVAENALAQSGSQAGSYTLASTNPPVGNTLLSNTITGLGYFAIGIKELPQSYVSSTTTQTLTTPVLQGDVNQLIIGVQVVASGNFSPLTVSNIDFSTNGTSNVADIANAKLYYTGTTATFATTTQVGATIATPGATFSINPAQTLADGTNYFWLVYDIAEDAINMNVVDAECTSVTVGGTPYVPTETAPAGTRTIRARLAGTYLVGVGGDYNTITSAVTDLNALGVKAPVVFALTDTDYSTAETFPITINAIVNSSAVNFVLIKPAPGVSPVITGNSTSPIFVVNASNFGIDGSNVIDGTTRDLTIINNGVGASSGIVFSTNAGNYLSYKNFVGIGGLTTAGFGIVLNGVTMTEVKNCKISKTAIGVQAQANCTQILIEGNEIGASVAAEKVHTNGIVAFNTNNFSIKNNTVSGISSASSATASAIVVAGTSSLGQVSGNLIKDIKNVNSTGWGSNGIWLNTSNTNAQVSIFNNIITDIASVGYSGWGTGDNGYGIIIAAGGGYGIYFNTIRLTTDQTATTGGNTAGINILAAITTANSLDIRNNIITSSQTKGNRYAIYSAATNAVFAHIDNNNYFAPTGIGFLGTASTTLAAWQTATGKDVNSLNVMPYFTSASDFSLLANMNCALDGHAAPLAQVTLDFLGVDRDATNPDMGAIEFTAVPLSAPVANNEEICSGGTVPSLVATTVGTAKWYSDEELNTLVFTGNTFATGQTDAGEYTYYVTDTYGTCISGASMVTLSVHQTPAQPELPVGPITAISNEVSEFSITEVVGATSYEWFLTPAEAGVVTPDGATASIEWNINFAGTASLSVQAHNVNCSSAVSDILEVEVSLAQFNLTLVADPTEGGSVIGEGTFDVGASVEISATSAIGYEFISWTNEVGDVVSNSASYAFEMPASSITLTANFQQVAYTLTLLVNPIEGGEVSGDGFYFYDEAANITATANAGYKFVNWTDEDDYVVSSVANFEFSMPDADVTLTANFEAVYTVTFNVVDEDSNPIDDAVVTLNGTAYPAGQYVITDLGVGYYTYFVSKEAYTSEGGNFTLVDQDEVVNVTLTLGTNPTYTVTFNVVDEGSAPITDAIITFNGVAAAAGEYVFTNVEAGAYEFSVAREGFVTIEDVATVVDEDITIPITLIHVGINSNTLSNLSAYPNPFSNQITISNPSLVSRVVVANLIGQVVMDIRTNGLATLETASLSAGVYLVTFEAANGDRLVRKMVKK